MAVVALRAAARLWLAAFSILCVAEAAASESAPIRLAALEPAASTRPPAPDSGFSSKWRHVETAMRADLRRIARCRAEPETCTPASRQFVAIVEAAQKREGRARIGEINRAVNFAIRPVSDTMQHGVADVWTPPLQTLAAARGDCEDYAIAKFAALRDAGFAVADLRFLVVHEAGAPSHHAVVSVRLDGNWLILDNRRLVMADQVSYPARVVLTLQAEEAPKVADKTEDKTVLAAGALDGLQSLASWPAPPMML